MGSVARASYEFFLGLDNILSTASLSGLRLPLPGRSLTGGTLKCGRPPPQQPDAAVAGRTPDME